jgi:hypothetical protein
LRTGCTGSGSVSRGGVLRAAQGGRDRYIARIPAGMVPGDPREFTLTSADLTGLMDQLDDLFSAAWQRSGLTCGGNA